MIEKSLLLQILDQIWKEHLLTLDHLRQGIGLRAYGQRDPLNEYKREAFGLFQGLLDRLRERVTQVLAHLEVRAAEPPAEEWFLPPPPREMRETREDPAFVGTVGEMTFDEGPGRGDTATAAPVRSRQGAAAGQPARPVDLGPCRPQRALPLRLRQEIQTLPRAAGLSTAPRPGRRARSVLFDPSMPHRPHRDGEMPLVAAV